MTHNTVKYIALFLHSLFWLMQLNGASCPKEVHLSISFDSSEPVERKSRTTSEPIERKSRKKEVVVHDEQAVERYHQFTQFTHHDFAQWTQQHGIPAEELFAQYELYHYNGFLELLRAQPDYEHQISALHNRLEVDYENCMSRICGYLAGNYVPGLRNAVAREYQRMRRQRAAVICAQQDLHTQQISAAHACHTERAALEVHTRHLLQNSHHNIANIRLRWSTYPTHDRMRSRLAALEQVVEHSNHEYRYTEYPLDLRLSQQGRYNPEQLNALRSCYGNQFQQTLHQEFVDIVNLGSNKAIDHVLHTHFQGVLPDMVELGVRANRAGYVIEASALADCCWAILDCAHAFAEGIVDGCVVTAQSIVDAVAHPIETATHLVSSIATLAHTLASAACVVPELGYYYVTDTKRYYLRQHEIVAYTTTLLATIYTQITATSRHDIIRHSTAFITQAVLTDRLLAVCAQVVAKIPSLLKTALPNPTTASAYALITVPGISALPRRTLDTAIPAILTDVGITPTIALHKKIAKAADLLGAQSEKISLHLLNLERETPHLVACFEHECAWLRSNNIPVPKIDCMHLFGMELMPSKEHLKLGGFHHDYLGQLEKSGIIRVEVLDQTAEGFYKAQVWVGSIAVKERKTFFPQYWTREEVIQCVMETYQDSVRNNIRPRVKPDGKYLLEHCIPQYTLSLRFHLDQKNTILSVYPFLEGVDALSTKIN